MLQSIRQAGLVWPALFTVAGFAILVGLGNWQLQRSIWKAGLTDRIEARVEAMPVPLREVAAAFASGGDVAYRRVSVSGRFLHGKERHYYFVGSYGPGWNVYTPLQLDDGGIVFVNRGFVPEQLRQPASRAAGQLAGQVTLTGLVRLAPENGAKGWFVPDNQPEDNAWFHLDLAGMRGSVFDASDASRVLGFFVDAEAEPANPGGWPKGGTTRLQLPNRHLEYAFTWFGLAGTLVCVFLAFAWSRLSR